jgi:hypothetical protein
MTTLTADAPPVNADIDTTDFAADFAPFTSADLEWAALAFNDDDSGIDEGDLAACESAFLDAHEAGLFSPDVAERIARSSLVGLAEVSADFILHRGSDPGWCVRTRHYA